MKLKDLLQEEEGGMDMGGGAPAPTGIEVPYAANPAVDPEKTIQFKTKRHNTCCYSNY